MNNLWLSQESISFQTNSKFKEDLSSCIHQLQTEDVRSGRNHEILQKLQKVIFDNSKVAVIIVQEEDQFGIRIGIPMLKRNHVLFDEVRQTVASTTDLVKLVGNRNYIKGFADPVTGKIGGEFSKVPVNLHLPNYDVFKSGLTADQIAAIILHEIGHLWCYYYYFGAVVKTSAIFEYVQRNLANDPDNRVREAVVTTAGRMANMSESDIKELNKVDSRTVQQTIIVSNVAESIRSDLGVNIFDQTTWEALADEYAVRMGAGIELATALDIINRRGSSRSYRSKPMYLLFEIIKLVLIAIPGINFIGIMFILMDSSSVYHDDPEARMKRIREQYVQGLKDPKISADQRQDYLDSIDKMNELLIDVEDKRQFLNVLVEALVPSLRRRKSTLDKIRILESLAANELFVISQQLKNDLRG